jgi:hypothetical protein
MDVGQLVRVWTDVGERKPVPLLAKIVEIDESVVTIRYLSDDGGVWRYEEDVYEIDVESIAEKLRTHLETDLGFRPTADGGFIKEDSDADYVPESEDEESTDESDDDEDEEEDFEEEFEASDEESLDEYQDE